MILTFMVQNQTCTRTDRQRVVANSRQYLYIRAAFTRDWDAAAVSCILYAPESAEPLEAVKKGGDWIVPEQLIREGGFYLSFAGVCSDGTVITTDQQYVAVKASGYISGAMPEDQEPTKYEALMQEIKAVKEAGETAAETVKTNAAAAAQSADDAEKTAQELSDAVSQAIIDMETIQDAVEGIQADITQKHGEVEADRAEVEENAGAAEQAKEGAQQAYSDFLNQLGSDVATLVGGKIPMSQIPATATQEIYQVSSEDELTGLAAQRGDLAELIETVDGEKTVTKTWQCLGDASIRDNWVVWGTSYAVQAGNAETAANAENANTINHHRVITMSQSEFETAVKDENTLYLVGD